MGRGQMVGQVVLIIPLTKCTSKYKAIENTDKEANSSGSAINIARCTPVCPAMSLV